LSIEAIQHNQAARIAETSFDRGAERKSPFCDRLIAGSRIGVGLKGLILGKRVVPYASNEEKGAS
jgi:hypothetical protein